MQYIPSHREEKLATVLALDPTAQSLDDIDVIVQCLPEGERKAFLVRQHGVWAREFARHVSAWPNSEGEEELSIMLGISARIAELPR
jgi:hypothetical protein